MKDSKVSGIIKLITSITICLAAGVLGSIFTIPSIPTWYETLIKPSFTPPNWVFAPVWTSLFIMMGISLYIIWQKGSSNGKALSIFSVQLILNVLWSAIFFGLRSPLAGLIEICILWILILLTILEFMKISRTAGLLLIPYILWVSFAALINFFIWRLNN